MTQEEKDLLLKDLCARLPYNVKCEVVKRNIDGEMLFIRNLELTVDNVKELVTNDMYEIKPYLFPLSSMTEEQRNDLTKFVANGITNENIVYDWFNKNHFDYRGLIPLGLAIDATGLNIY